MNQNQFSTPVSLRQMDITDAFWRNKMELVRREMLPYQWKALNDQMEGAEPSFCIHNFRAAANWNSRRREQGETFREPEFTFRGFQTLPEDPNNLQDNFYGFVFQDSDLYKWIEAVAYSLIRYPDADQEEQADEAIDLICAAQQEDGYLDTYYILNGKNKIFSNLRDHHELYCFGHLVEAAVAYYQAHVPVRQQGEVTGHAVRAMYLYSGMADLARINRDQELQDACERLWDNMLNQKLYITGGIGGTHIGEAFSYPYDLPNDTAYAETCASVGLVFWARRMLQIRADARYGDVMELALYNSVLSGVALDGKSFFYVNPLQVTPEACRLDERKSHVKPVRQKWFGCACCPPNLARLLSSIASYAYTENEDTLFIHLFMQGTVRKMVQGETAEISLTTDYPWDGTIRVSVKGTSHPLTIALRIPAWCGQEYQIRGTETGDTWMENGYLYIKKIWMEEDLVDLTLPMEVRIMEADSRVREDIGKVAVMRGPFVYCLEEVDNGPDLHLLSLDVNSEPQIVKQEIGGREVPGIVLWGYRKEAVHIEEPGLYRAWRKSPETRISLKFIPYYTWANRGENEMQVWVDRCSFIY